MKRVMDLIRKIFFYIRNHVFKRLYLRFKKKHNDSDINNGKLALFFVAVYVVVYLCFCGKGFIDTGVDLTKSDWLSFCGSFLSFVGTIFVAYVSLTQTKNFAVASDMRLEKERFNEIQPVFVLSVIDHDTLPYGRADVFNPGDPLPEHKNFTLLIQNVGEHPALHVRIFDKYIYEVLCMNDSKKLQCAFFDSPDAKMKVKSNLLVLSEKFERNSHDLPKTVCVEYIDIDGNQMVQKFRFENYGGRNFCLFVSKDVIAPKSI